VIPYAQIDTIFLDHGNTLVSIDFDWVTSELASRCVKCLPDALRRAEAAARPAFSQRLFVDGIGEGVDLFGAYLLAMFDKLDATAALSASDLDSLVAELIPVLRPDGRASGLWRSVMPRVPEALTKLRELGIALAVVSNSDGTVERSLEAAGLRSYLSVVIDSAVAGYEKPDPRIFHRAIEACGAQPDRTLHVGDLYHADVAGARGAGLHALLLDPFHDWPSIDCERVPDLWTVADLVARAREHPAV
jgi:HAD superfamily hydrolase (TIGR01509 family)